MIDDPLNRPKVKRGSDLPHSKLTDDDVRMILQIVEDREEMKRVLKGMTNAAIAHKFGVHVRSIDRVVTGVTWGHVL